MDIYNVIIDWSVDFDCTDSPRVVSFLKYEDALEAFDMEVRSAKKDGETFEDMLEEVKGDETNRYYAVYSDGRWAENHIQIQLEKQKI